MSIPTNAIPALSSGYRLQWEPAQDCHVLLYPEGMVQLNGPAAAILQQVDGQRDLATIIATLEQDFQQSGLGDDVIEFIDTARQRGWLHVSP